MILLINVILKSALLTADDIVKKYIVYVYIYIYIYSGCVCSFLYGCETWSLTLREERMLRVFENMVFRRIFGPRREEVMGERRRSITRS